MRKIVIIGANSYIARNIIYVLKSEYSDLDVKLYDFSDSHMDGESDYMSIHILDKKSVEKIDFDCDVVFMFVGKTGSVNGFDMYDSFIDINQRALLNVLNEVKNQNSKAKIIFPSTRLVYKGKIGALSEDDEKEFKTIYAANKFVCEQYLKQYNNVFNIQYCIFRIGIPYGTLIPRASSYGTTEFMLNQAAKGENITLYGDGTVRRTLTYMGDLCHVLIEGAFSKDCINDVFNIGGEDYSLKEMAELIAERYAVKIEYVQYPEIALKIESGDTVFDDKKLQSRCETKYLMKFSDWCKKQ